MNRYQGKEPCQGCHLPGSDNPRFAKDRLCYKCEELLLSARKKGIESKIEYRLVFQHFHTFNSGNINKLAHNFLAAIHNEHAENTGSVITLSKEWGGSNGKYYKIDSRFVQPLSELLKLADSIFCELKEDKEDLPRLAEKEVTKLKNKIFNEGVTEGRNLLIQLNAGKISLQDLEKELIYKPQ